MKPALDLALAFLFALFDGHAGLIELRALPQVRRTTFQLEEPDEARRFIAENAHQNVYVGVALRRVGGGAEACIALPALFVDIDFKVTPRDQARAAVRRFPLKPSVVVRSGGGVHLYWLLREPMVLPEEAGAAKDLLRRIALHLGGDLSAAEPARILRLPGTRNHKYTPPAAVELSRLNAGWRYNPHELEDFLPREPQAELGSDLRFTLPSEVGDGARNATLYRFGRSLKAKGATEPEIAAALATVNAVRCRPPLEDAEVRLLAHNVAIQQDQAGFRRRVKGVTREELIERLRNSEKA